MQASLEKTGRRPHRLIPGKEGRHVKRDGLALTVHCFFTEENPEPRELILQSLRLWIEQTLRKRAES